MLNSCTHDKPSAYKPLKINTSSYNRSSQISSCQFEEVFQSHSHTDTHLTNVTALILQVIKTWNISHHLLIFNRREKVMQVWNDMNEDKLYIFLYIYSDSAQCVCEKHWCDWQLQNQVIGWMFVQQWISMKAHGKTHTHTHISADESVLSWATAGPEPRTNRQTDKNQTCRITQNHTHSCWSPQCLSCINP